MDQPGLSLARLPDKSFFSTDQIKDAHPVSEGLGHKSRPREGNPDLANLLGQIIGQTVKGGKFSVVLKSKTESPDFLFHFLLLKKRFILITDF